MIFWKPNINLFWGSNICNLRQKFCFLSYFITNIVTVLPETSTHKFAPRCHLIFFFFDSPLDFVFLSFLKRGSDKRGSDVVLHNWLDYITLSTFQWNSYFSFSASTNVFSYWKMLFAYYTTILLNETKRKHVHQIRINMRVGLSYHNVENLTKSRKPIECIDTIHWFFK